MSAHTPGPWWFGITTWDNDSEEMASPQPAEYSGQGYGGNPYIFGANNYRIVGCDEYDVFGDWDDDAQHGRREANIRLMLASPDLLEALSEMTELAAGPTGGVTVAEKKSILAKARAAIAKATAA